MKLRNILPLLIFFFIASFSFAQTADDLVNNNIKAKGGKDKIAGIKSLKMKGNIDVGPEMKAPFTICLKGGNKFHFELEIQGMKMIQSLDGDSGWYINPFGGKTDPERMSPEEVSASKEQADFTGPLYDYKSKGSTVESLGKEDMEGTDTYKLKVTKKNGDVSYIFLDATSYFQLKETTKHKFKDKEIESATISSNYKSVDGIMFPFSFEQRGSGEDSQGQAMNMESIEVNPVIDDAIFKMPAAAPESGSGKTK
ncbi:MAG: hypothetical protein NT126_11960 [Bacteroidetes bacterium]|nr:hypothetical protein [Bacteroidota bacterium]